MRYRMAVDVTVPVQAAVHVPLSDDENPLPPWLAVCICDAVWHADDCLEKICT